MENLWVIVGLAAVSVQTLRSGLMKHLRHTISDQAIMLARFGASTIFTVLWLFMAILAGFKLPSLNAHFIVYALIAALTQAIGGFFSWRYLAGAIL
jgi:hypothetical protein